MDTSKINAEKILHDALTAQVSEARRKRRWSIFFRLLMITLTVGYIAMVFQVKQGRMAEEAQAGNSEHVALVELKDTISNDKRSDATAAKIIDLLGKAFDAKGSMAVIIEINSPGGSPVQSAQIYREIERLKEKYPHKKVYAVAEDIAASGAYYVAAAADEIYADANSMVGSIGVIMGGFGFTELMEKAGVERRVYTAGESKAFMDPFSDVDSNTVPHLHGMLKGIHANFINAVKKGRGDRLKGQEAELFSGLVWTGTQALEMGLVDGLMSSQELARDVLGVQRIVRYSPDRDTFELIMEGLAIQAQVIGQQLFSVQESRTPMMLPQ